MTPLTRGEVRLRDIPKLDRYGRWNTVAAVLVFSTVGLLLGSGAARPLRAGAVLLLTCLGVANMAIVDRRLEEVPANE